MKTVNVRDFGATGNGETDDTEAFQKAADAVSAGGLIRIPAGTYRFTWAPVVSELVIFQGEKRGEPWAKN